MTMLHLMTIPTAGLALLLTTFANAAPMAKPVLKTAWGKVIANCQLAKGVPAKSHLWIFKQWHLPPSINTHDNQNTQDLPQQKNQAAIYQQLNQWIAASQINTVFAEGCSGSIDRQFGTAFNGWTLKDLMPLSQQPGYAAITTHVPLKLEAKFGEGLTTKCADDESLIKNQNLAFSDARGITSFYSRLTQFKNDPKKAKTYLQGVVELYHLPSTTTVDQALTHLKTELRNTIKTIDAGLNARNSKIVDIVSQNISTDAALVIGGLHATGLMQLLPAKGIGCTVVEPIGYEPDAEKSMIELRNL